MDKNKRLDKIDLNILSVLQSEARITNHDLSERVHLSASSCLNRVRKLEEEGYIDGYLTRVNLDKVCRSVTILVTVSLNDHTQENFQEFEKAIQDFPEIVECYTVSGSFDYFLRVVCPDMNSYLSLNDKLVKQVEGIANLSSHVTLASQKPFRGYPLERLVE